LLQKQFAEEHGQEQPEQWPPEFTAEAAAAVQLLKLFKGSDHFGVEGLCHCFSFGGGELLQIGFFP
jgi:hypothetical protein